MSVIDYMPLRNADSPYNLAAQRNFQRVLDELELSTVRCALQGQGELVCLMAASTSAIPVCAVGIMAKAPQARRSKTRLCPPLRPEQAALLSGAFLRDTSENLRIAARSAPIAPYAAYSPLGSEAALRSVMGCGVELLLADGNSAMPDGVDGFGRCLLQAIEGMLGAGHLAACVLSSDSPTLPNCVLRRAADILLPPGDRAVLGATHDGGYYLLGLKTPNAHLFRDIAWSTSSVADQTRARAYEVGLPLIELDTWYDVDDAPSLATLLSDQRGYAAPSTNEMIDRLDLRRLLGLQTTAGAFE